MINIDFTNIDNAKLIGRLLPFWARGKRLSLFLMAILSPLASAHRRFKTWALERFIEYHITAQKMSLEWYLKYRLKSHFVYEGDAFLITHGINETVACFSSYVWQNGLHWSNDLRWDVNTEAQLSLEQSLSCINTGLWEDILYWDNSFTWENEENDRKYNNNYVEEVGVTIVYAPAIVDTVNYNHEDYVRDIRNIMAKYMINFSRIKIIILNTEY